MFFLQHCSSCQLLIVFKRTGCLFKLSINSSSSALCHTAGPWQLKLFTLHDSPPMSSSNNNNNGFKVRFGVERRHQGSLLNKSPYCSFSSKSSFILAVRFILFTWPSPALQFPLRNFCGQFVSSH